MELSKNRFTYKETFVVHANAALAPRARLRLSQLINEDQWPVTVNAQMLPAPRHSPEKGGPLPKPRCGRNNRLIEPSPLHAHPHPADSGQTDHCASLAGPTRSSPDHPELDMPTSTVHAVLVRADLNRLPRIDLVTGEPIPRYEPPYPGSLIHVDVTKFGRNPDRGWTPVRRQTAGTDQASNGVRSRGHSHQPISTPARDEIPAHRH